jgi:hypothetical protein
MKECKKCKEHKPLTEYFKMNQKLKLADGTVKLYEFHHSYCKPCLKIWREEKYAKQGYDKQYNIKNRKKISDYQQGYYESNAERINERTSKYYQDNAAYLKAKHREWVENNRGSIAAYTKIIKAVKSGELYRPNRCECCNREVRTEAHHHNGYKPPNDMKIIWVCRKKHRQYHRKFNQEVIDLFNKLWEDKYGSKSES